MVRNSCFRFGFLEECILIFADPDDPFTLSNPTMPPTLVSLFLEYITRLTMVHPNPTELQAYLHLLLLNERKRVDVTELRRFSWKCGGDVRKGLLGCMVGIGEEGGLKLGGEESENWGERSATLGNFDEIFEATELRSVVDELSGRGERLQLMVCVFGCLGVFAAWVIVLTFRRLQAEEPEHVDLDGEANMIYYAGVSLKPPLASSLGWAPQANNVGGWAGWVSDSIPTLVGEETRPWWRYGDKLEMWLPTFMYGLLSADM